VGAADVGPRLAAQRTILNGLIDRQRELIDELIHLRAADN
jgi:hypothetical protein